MARTTPNPGHNLDYHLIPFEAAFKAGARQIMLYYSRPIGTQYEEVGASFNKGLITDLLRGHYGFEGIVVTDWGLLTSRNYSQPLVAIAWGVEDLTPEERIVRIIEAGCDQFRGQYRETESGGDEESQHAFPCADSRFLKCIQDSLNEQSLLLQYW